MFNWFQRILPRTGDFFGMFEAHARTLVAAADALSLLVDRKAATMMGTAARKLVIDTLSWPAMLAPLPGFLGREPKGEGRRDAA